MTDEWSDEAILQKLRLRHVRPMPHGTTELLCLKAAELIERLTPAARIGASVMPRPDALPVKRLRDFIALRPMLQEQFDGPSKRPFTFTMEEAQTIIETMAAMGFYLSSLPKPNEVTT